MESYIYNKDYIKKYIKIYINYSDYKDYSEDYIDCIEDYNDHSEDYSEISTKLYFQTSASKKKYS